MGSAMDKHAKDAKENGCPVCSGLSGVLAAPRHAASWREMTASEQMLFLLKLDELLKSGFDGALRISNDHGHFHLDLTGNGQGNPSHPRLVKGGDDPLLPLLEQCIDKAVHVDLAVAFVMESGVMLIEPWLEDLLVRGGRLRMIVGDYLDVTQPQALWRLLDLADGEKAKIFIYETSGQAFHPKAWLFRAENAKGSAIVGSSNLSHSALTKGIEWNLHSENALDEVAQGFAELITHPNIKRLTPEWIEAYEKRRGETPLAPIAAKLVSADPVEPPPEPHALQKEALKALEKTRASGKKAGLVVMATGLGKTWLAAFDSRESGRILFG